MTLSVGGLRLLNPLVLSPMAGITLAAVRNLFWKLGVALAHTEMVSGAGLIRENQKTSRMLQKSPIEGPLVLQLFAGDWDTLVRGAERALKTQGDFQAFSINMACPMPKVTKKGAGAKLLERPHVAWAMVKELKGLGLPVWVKMRKISPKTSSLNALDFVSNLAESGADNICIHGRTKEERYEGKSDLDEVIKIAKAFPGLISASGDMTDLPNITKALEGGCVSVFLARGVLLDPFLVPRSLLKLGYNDGNSMAFPSLDDRIEVLRSLGQDLLRLHGEKTASVLIKRFASGIFRGVPGCGLYKRAMAESRSWEKIQGLVEDPWGYFERGFGNGREGTELSYAGG